MACRRAAIARAKAEKARGGEGSVTDTMPKATMRHWTTERCEGASKEDRGEIAKCMAELIEVAKRLKGEGAVRVRELCTKARCAALKAQRGEGTTDGEWEALAQVAAAQMPNPGEIKRELEGRVDALRRRITYGMMVW